MIEGNLENGERFDDDMPLERLLNDDPELRLKLGQHFGAIRRKRNTPQEAAAKAMEMSRPHLSNIEQGRSRTGWSGLRKMAKYYTLSINELINEVAAMDMEPPRHVTAAARAQHAQSGAELTDDERIVLAGFRMLDGPERQQIAKQISQAVQQRLARVGRT